MQEKYSRKQSYEFCNITNLMVRADFIEAIVSMDDGAQGEVTLEPINCNRKSICQKQKIKCSIFEKNGEDPF